jgi:hypothetical protein
MPMRADVTALAPRSIPMMLIGMAIYRVMIVSARGMMMASNTFPLIMIGPIASVEGENVLPANPTIAFNSTHVKITVVRSMMMRSANISPMTQMISATHRRMKLTPTDRVSCTARKASIRGDNDISIFRR